MSNSKQLEFRSNRNESNGPLRWLQMSNWNENRTLCVQSICLLFTINSHHPNKTLNYEDTLKVHLVQRAASVAPKQQYDARQKAHSLSFMQFRRWLMLMDASLNAFSFTHPTSPSSEPSIFIMNVLNYFNNVENNIHALPMAFQSYRMAM